MSILSETHAGDHPSREAVQDHTEEMKENPKRDHEALEFAKRAENRLKKDESDQLFTH